MELFYTVLAMSLAVLSGAGIWVLLTMLKNKIYEIYLKIYFKKHPEELLEFILYLEDLEE